MAFSPGLQYLSGLFAFFFQLASESLRASLLPGHIAMGMCIYILAIITVRPASTPLPEHLSPKQSWLLYCVRYVCVCV